MSQMRMYCAGAGTLWVKVINFQSSLDGQVVSSQTKNALHHFPRKATHQNVTFQIVCRDSRELAIIQSFVERHQRFANTSPDLPEVMLWWPERNIIDWSGIIKKVEAGDKRFNVAPKISLTFELVDSLLSEKTWWSSRGEDYSKFFSNTIDPPGDWKQPLPPLPPLDSQWGGGGAGGTF